MGSADAKKVNYVDMAEKTKDMRECAKEICDSAIEMYNIIGEMHADWYGVRYNELVKSFNKMCPDINKILSLVFEEIPTLVGDVARQYSDFDQNRVSVAEGGRAKKISELPIIDDTGKIRFMTANVEKRRVDVDKKISAITEDLNKYQMICNNLDWDSPAADEFRNKIKNQKENLENEFVDLKRQFSELMLQAESDLEATERANTVS